MKLVSLSDLKPGMVVGKTIFGNNGQLLLKQGVVITDRYIVHLRRHGIDVVYISTGQEVMPQDVVSDETRVQALGETRKVLEKVKRGASLEIEQVHLVLIKVIDELLLQDDVMINLVDIRSFDEELFSHSVNVAILSIIVGIELKYSKDQLRTLAIAALLHDVGMLLNGDYEHVATGRRVLQKNGRIDSGVVLAVYQHHERWDGQGYPEGISGKEICQNARIISVADTFDRMSANSKYPMEEVIEYLMAMSGTEFEPESVRAFINCVSFYPVGTRVELNTGECGFVAQANRGFPTRPIVRIDRNIYGVVKPGYELNLIENPTYFIIRKQDDIGVLGDSRD